MKKVTYLAIVEPSKSDYGIFFPDLPGCTSMASSIEEAFEMAKEALELHYYGMEKSKESIPLPSMILDAKDTEGCFVIPVTIYPELVKRKLDNRKVKTNCTIAAWIKDLAEENHINYSQLLENAILEYLDVKKSLF